MVSRRSVLSSLIASPVFAVSAKLFAGAATGQLEIGYEGEPDRELRLKLSNLRQWQWLYAGQRYSESGAVLWLNEGEKVRAKILNDLYSPQTLQLAGLPWRQVPANVSTSEDLVNTLAVQSELVLDIAATSPLAKAHFGIVGGEVIAIQVRACDQPHPLVA